MMLLRFQSVTSASSRRAIASGFRHSATTSLSNCPQSSCLSSSSSSSSQLIQCLPSHFRFLSVVSVAASQQVGRAEEQIRQYLLSQEFKAEQVDRLLPHLIGPVEFVGFKGLDTNSRCQIVQQSINFWKQHLKPIAISKLKINLHKDYVQDAKIQNQFAKNAKYQTILVDHNYVFAYVEPDLLFIDPVLMERRLKMLKNVGFISGNTDLWRVFVICPRGNN